MKLYFYCILRDFKGGKLPVVGVGGQKIFHIRGSGLCAAVSATSQRRYELTDANVDMHERVIQAYIAAYPILPYRLNTIVGERIGRGILQKYKTELMRDLQKVKGQVQFRVRVVRNPNVAGESPVGSLMSRSELRSRMRNYLGRGPSRQGVRKTFVLKQEVYRERLLNPLQVYASATKTGRMTGKRQILNHLFLVSQSQADRFRTQFDEFIVDYPELSCTLSGPEPPYDFLTVAITQDNRLE